MTPISFVAATLNQPFDRWQDTELPSNINVIAFVVAVATVHEGFDHTGVCD